MFSRRRLCLLFVTVPMMLMAGHTSSAPCPDFYQYACKAWLAHAQRPPSEPVWNPWISASYEINHRLTKILKHHNPTLIKPKTFYDSCLKSTNEDQYLKELRKFVENLGGWPIIDNARNKSDWFKQLTIITRDLGIHPIFKIHADLDYKNPKKVLIYIEPGDLILPQHILTEKGYDAEIEAYEKWINGTISHMYKNAHIKKYEIKEIIKFERSLAMLRNEKVNERTTVRNLNKKLKVNWLEALRNIFGNFIIIDLNTTVAVKNYEYLKNVFLLIQKTEGATNYLIWATVKELSRETTSHMRNLNFLIDKAILGVTDDLSREDECMNKVIKYFSPLLLPPYLKNYIESKTMQNIFSMFKKIKTEYIRLLMESEWLSGEGKLLSVEKIKNIGLNLGYPKEIFHGKSLLLQFQKVVIANDHFRNVLILKKFNREFVLQRLINYLKIWPSTPFDVNAYYSVLQNDIFVPMGLIIAPFYIHRNEALNFGTLGFLMAHEISHALDPVGILADNEGKIRNWFPKSDLNIYKEKIKCFGEESVLGENLADTIGLKISLNALKNAKINEENNFFLGYAQMWCETSETVDIFKNDEHSVNFERVQILQRNTDFQDLFKCGSGSECELW